MNPKLCWLLRYPFYGRPLLDQTLCKFMPRRLTLPAVTLGALFPDFDAQPVVLDQLPLGSWSTPLADVVMLLKLALCARPRRVMEVGSYRGYTARALARHLSDDARLVTVDCYQEHGEAYRDTPLATKIERRVGRAGPEVFGDDAPGSYDLIFVDADHLYESVLHDTGVVLPLVSPHGYIVWHDYDNWGFFNGSNGVPEYLRELSASRAIGHVFSTTLAIHSPSWDTPAGRVAFEKAVVPDTGETDSNPWHTKLTRG